MLKDHATKNYNLGNFKDRRKEENKRRGTKTVFRIAHWFGSIVIQIEVFFYVVKIKNDQNIIRFLANAASSNPCIIEDCNLSWLKPIPQICLVKMRI